MDANAIALPEDTNTHLIMAGEEEARNRHVQKILNIGKEQKRKNLEERYWNWVKNYAWWRYDINEEAYSKLDEEERNACEAMVLECAENTRSRTAKVMRVLSLGVCASALFHPGMLIFLLFTICVPLTLFADERNLLSRKKEINLLLLDE